MSGRRAPDVDALDAIFRPRSIAVIGASRRPGTIGGTILWNLVSNGFAGKVFPVNPSADVVHSIRCHPTVGSIPDEVDLAVIAVPAKFVLGIARQCVKKGVRALCVISAGFREIGPKGAAEEARLLALCRRHGMRLL